MLLLFDIGENYKSEYNKNIKRWIIRNKVDKVELFTESEKAKLFATQAEWREMQIKSVLDE